MKKKERDALAILEKKLNAVKKNKRKIFIF
jgi:hypothetical protein